MAHRRFGSRCRHSWRRRSRRCRRGRLLERVAEVERTEPRGNTDRRDGKPRIEAANRPNVGPVVLVRRPGVHGLPVDDVAAAVLPPPAPLLPPRLRPLPPPRYPLPPPPP